MVLINKIYTKSGDRGETSLGDGSRRKKYDLRVEAYGTVDEANSQLGLAACYCPIPVQNLIICIQNDLFDLGADLCKPLPKGGVGQNDDIRITPDQTEQIEKAIDDLNVGLPELTSFIIPGGSILSAQFHIVRTVVRRAERLVVELAEDEAINPEIIKYLNRLSDLLFVIARQANYVNPQKNGEAEILWNPKGIDRKITNT